jgi:hypothetical protein
MDGGLAGRNQEKTFENVGDAPGTILRVRLLHGNHSFLDLGFYTRLAARPRFWCQPVDTTSPIGTDPAPDRVVADAELLTDQGDAVAFLQKELYDPEAELDWVGPRPGTVSYPLPLSVFSFSSGDLLSV